MRSKFHFALLLILLQGSFVAVGAQSRGAALRSTLVPAEAAVPHRNTAAALHLFGSGYRFETLKPAFFSQETISERSAFWTEKHITLLEAGQGRFAIEGCQREYSGRALLYASAATPSRDALRLEQGAATLGNAPTSYSLRFSLRLARRP